MTFYSALKKLSNRKKTKSYYNSDDILNAKEKQALLTSIFVVIFPLFIGVIFFLTN